ncbi:Transmembrane protein 184 [Sphaceloma murrayae]|uniref:Transmembrane protein 184 n=1 Tax=Sphaceloma murrayae TaxID=2082308 RepID=A0A2K1QNY3_9PEZI|nr:Transmembrane protein 184 [Sphaceloma murrayae]
MGDQNASGGTGSRFAKVVIILAGVSALIAIFVTFLSIWLQSKNYRKPLLQRYVIRILVLVPIFAASSWASLTSIRVAFWIDPFRDVYEAFVLYAFFQLLINFLGGERSLIIMMHGRAPVSHIWPMHHCLPKVDISDPHTFLAVKRGILQYTWIKPFLAISTIIMKATGTYQEGYIGISSGYLWSGVIYNLSITISLYALALFWVCMSRDLQPFRPMPKFLCIKGIIFASYWQGFFLSILVWLGAVPDLNKEYTADNLAAAIQDALICFEMPLFAFWHWYAFSWHDYADKTISDARMPVKYALRDAFGARDLIEDAKETFYGTKYEYRYFDAEDNVITHEDSSSREARMREGMRYERGGRGKYWLPDTRPDAKTPLLAKKAHSRARGMSPGARKALDHLHDQPEHGVNDDEEDPSLDPEVESLYRSARTLEFGDWNYPVINTHYASREDRMRADPNILTGTTNQAILHPGSKTNKQRRKSRVKDLKDSTAQGKQRQDSSSQPSSSSASGSRRPQVKHADSSTSSASGRSQLVDILVEDSEAGEVERVRARKEGGPGWNNLDRKHFVNAYEEGDGETVREGFNPDRPIARDERRPHNMDSAFAVGEEEEESGEDELGHHQPWDHRRFAESDTRRHDYGSFHEERDVWEGRSGR